MGIRAWGSLWVLVIILSSSFHDNDNGTHKTEKWKEEDIWLTELFTCLLTPDNASVAPRVAPMTWFSTGIAPGIHNLDQYVG